MNDKLAEVKRLIAEMDADTDWSTADQYAQVRLAAYEAAIAYCRELKEPTS